jgi:ABC-type multidrug transport system ATPase subunit
VMDEPAGGLDPGVRRQLIEILIEQAASRPMTIVFSSHILSDVERLVERVAFMKDGRVVKEGELESLRGGVKRLCCDSAAKAAAAKERFHIVREEPSSGGDWLAVVDDFAPEKMDGLEATVEHLNLEELFLVYSAGAAAGAAAAPKEAIA